MKDRLISEHRFVEDLYGCLDGFDFELKDVLNVLKGVESVDATPVVHGHWISVDDKYSATNHMYFPHRCSVCNVVFWLYKPHGVPINIDFCPNCGAKMDEKGEQDG